MKVGLGVTFQGFGNEMSDTEVWRTDLGLADQVQLGTMVTVLPWRDPVRVTGPVEFNGFGLPMETARQRFKETTEVVLQGLETGVMEYDGDVIQQPRVELHPQPFKSFQDRNFSVDKPLLRSTAGYEAHAVLYEQLSQPGGLEKMTELYVDLEPYVVA